MKWINARYGLRKVHEIIGALQRYGVLLTTLGVVIAFISYLRSEQDRGEQAYNRAWTAISIDGGRKRALMYLSHNGQSLQGAHLENSRLEYVHLEGADLNRSEMIDADLFGADLRHASIWGGRMKDVNLQFAHLEGSYLRYADLRCADLRGAHLERLAPRSKIPGSGDTILQQANLQFAHLEGADLTGANLINAKLENAYLNEYNTMFIPTQGCTRSSSGLTDIPLEHLGTEPSAGEICEWARKQPTQAGIKLPKAFSCSDRPKKPATDLTEADLTGASLRGANLTGANLTQTNLTDADLTGAEGITADQIYSAAYVCNTRLPDGTKSYRDCPEHGQQ